VDNFLCFPDGQLGTWQILRFIYFNVFIVTMFYLLLWYYLWKYFTLIG